jgi:HK97 family phage prohead protease
MDFASEFKLADDGEATGTISGYASVFNLLDRGGDIVLPGAFKASLAESKRAKRRVPMLWQHSSDQPVGIWDELTEDDRGLKVRGTLLMDVPQAVTARALIKGGAVSGLSIGFRTKEAEIDRTTGARKLKKIDLWEISLVTFPMLPEAQVSGVKNSHAFDASAWEQAFRDEGLSNREAKIATSVARKLSLRDEGISEPSSRRDGVADVLMALRKATVAARS